MVLQLCVETVAEQQLCCESLVEKCHHSPLHYASTGVLEFDHVMLNIVSIVD